MPESICFFIKGESNYLLKPIWKLTGKHLLFCLLLTISFSTSSAGAVAQQQIQPADSITVRSFEQQNLDRYLSDEEYRYDREYRPVSPSLWQRFKMWLFDKLFRALSDENTSNVLHWLMYIVCGAVILYVILRLTNTSIRGLIYGQSQSGRMAFTESEENIHELNFDQLIKEAVANKEYNRAIRLHYLKTLKILSDKELIDWRINKTNHDYIQELGKTDMVATFRRLTFLFEYFCYGDFSINETDFKEASNQFSTFEEQLKKTSSLGTSKAVTTS